MIYLGHNFKLIFTNKLRKAYICDNCGCEIDEYPHGYINFWDKNCHYSINPISCDEMIIKNIIE